MERNDGKKKETFRLLRHVLQKMLNLKKCSVTGTQYETLGPDWCNTFNYKGQLYNTNNSQQHQSHLAFRQHASALQT